MPTYNTDIKFLEECIESVLSQSYPLWELCIADDASPNKQVVRKIKEYAKKDSRIRLVARKQNGHISEASNSAISVATGEFIALLDHDDILWPNALYEIVQVINQDPKVDLIYTDEDKIDEQNTIHSYPFFKPDWSPEFLESCNYITHFSCIRKKLVQDIGGFRKGYEGAQDWDLILRVTEKTKNIVHIPKVLYSWRVHAESTAQDTDTKPYVYQAQRKLLEDHVTRTCKSGKVSSGIIWQHSLIEYDLESKPKVSIILYGSKPDLKSQKTLKSSAGYSNIEFIVASPSGKDLAKALNAALQAASGEFVLFIASSAKITSKNWLKSLLSNGLRDGVGVVGGRRIDKDKKLMVSAGIGVGINGTYAPLLTGEPIDDNHYMRALHGKSRRNISAIEPPLLVKKELISQIGGFQSKNNDFLFVDLCLTLLDRGYRNIYNPYVDVIDDNPEAGLPSTNKSFKKKWQKYIDNDPYLNPNYNKNNGRLEVK